MANAYRDENNVPTLIACSNVDGQTPVRIYADPTTHRLLVDVTGTTSVVAPTSGSVNGVNTVFVFTTAPSAICVDQGRFMQKVSSDGTVNWTGTTTVTLSVAPIFDIFGFL